MSKKKFETKFGDPSLDYSGHRTTWWVKDNVKVDEVWAWIEEEIKQARIDENEKWMKRVGNFTGTVSSRVFEGRIKQLKEKL